MSAPRKVTSKGNSQVNVRLLSVRALHEIHCEDAYANIVMQQMISKHPLSDQDRHFFTELVYGVLRRQNYLDAIITQFTKKPLKKLSPWIMDILRLALYQMIYLDRVPQEAATDEAVKLAKKLARGLDPLVNGILRNFTRNRDAVSIEAISKNDREFLSYTYNQPQWILEELEKTYSIEEVKIICEYFNRTAQLKGRINTLKSSAETIYDILSKEGVRFSKGRLFPEAITIKSHEGTLREADWFKKGLIAFVDEGSLAIGHALHPQEGERILDMCAAPGGKTMHIATLMNNKGYIKACDVHDHKIDLINENARRLGVTIVDGERRDGTTLVESEINSYDRVLCDVPCSGLGILQKKLDMRWKERLESVEKLPQLQLALLEKGAQYVKEGGILLYSTCTLRKAENEDVIKAFLEMHDQFTVDDASRFMPFPVKGPIITMDPITFKTDGFFICRLRKGKKS